jgi:hypothetical protein
MRRGGFELLKVFSLVVLFVLIQKQIADLETKVSGSSESVVHALVDRQDDFEQHRRTLLDRLEDSRSELALVKMSLLESSRQLKVKSKELANLVANREEAFFETLDVEFSRYRGTLEDAVHHSEKNSQRIESMEAQVLEMSPGDSNWMVEAMIYPTIQIKGNKTVGSGVVIYSEPESAPGAGAYGGDDSVKYVTYAITAYHVVKEILGSDFPDATLKDVRMMDSRDPLGMTILSGKVEIYDAELDLALMRLRSDKPFAHVANLLPRDQVEDLDLFTRVYTVGCPLGNNPLPTSGEISSKGKVVDGRIFWMVNAPTFFGNSGGGIFLSGTCQLVGVSSMIYTYTYGVNQSLVVPHMGLFVPMNTVYDWLEGRGYKYVLDGAPVPDNPLKAIVTENTGGSSAPVWKVGPDTGADD